MPGGGAAVKKIPGPLAFLVLCAVLCVAASAAVCAAEAPAAPEDPEGLGPARAFLDRGLYDEAAGAAEDAVRLSGRPARPGALMVLARAHRMAGRHRRALELLRQAEAVLPAADSAAAQVAVMTGDCLVFLDRPEEAEAQFLRASGLIPGKDGMLQAGLLNARGNLQMQKGRHAEAAALYRASLGAAGREGGGAAVKAAVNGARACRAMADAACAGEFLEEASRRNAALPDTYEKGYDAIEIAMLQHRQVARNAEVNPGTLLEAFRIARTIDNRRLASQALGRLGSLYEEAGRYGEALDCTRRALFDAQLAGAEELLYRWQWQSGRIFVKQDRPEEAVDAYRAAAASLQAVRADSSAECKTFSQLPYDSVIEPLYTGLIDLLIRRSAAAGEAGSAEALLTEAVEALETMKVAEMQDYLQDNCLAPRRPWRSIPGSLDNRTAVIYPIPLDDRLEIILYVQGRMLRFSSGVGRKRFEDEVHTFRRRLEDRTRRTYLTNARVLYDWVMRPVEAELAARGVGTLVIIPNGALRTVPLQALHDGRDFLLARYAVVSAQGFTLLAPGAARQDGGGVLLAGISEAVQGFPALAGVSSEMEAIHAVYGGLTLRNREVTLPRMERELREKTYGIVHIATHGEIGETPQKTFLLAWDGRITMDHFERFMGPNRYRKNPVELLVLSACQTAAGNDRSALGLAGISLKAGARSSVGTLWSVDDRAAAELISTFYVNLKDRSLTRAEALRRAQLKIAGEPGRQHPYFWAPFIVMGSWL